MHFHFFILIFIQIISNLNTNQLFNISEAKRSLVLLRNGQLASGSFKKIHIWNITDWTLNRTLNSNFDFISSLFLLKNGYLISFSVRSGDIALWSTLDYQMSYIKRNFYKFRSIIAYGDDSFLVIDVANYIYLYNTNGEQIKQKFRTKSTLKLIECMCIMKNKMIIAIAKGNQIELRNGNLKSMWFGSYIRSLEGHFGIIKSLAAFNDGIKLASGVADDLKIIIWNTETGKLLVTIKEINLFHTLLVLNDNSIVTGCQDSNIRIRNPNNGSLIKFLNGHKKAVRSLALLTNEKLASGSDDGKIIIWKIDSSFHFTIKNLATKNYSLNIFSFLIIILFYK